MTESNECSKNWNGRHNRPLLGAASSATFKQDRSKMDLNFAQESFTLLADRAMLWPRRRALIVADTHFGKDALFQARGIPVPNDVTSNDLARLSALLESTESRELIVLGDFFHGKESNDEPMTRALHQWRDKHAQVTMTIVRGNHDQHAGDPCESLGIDCLNSLRFDAIKFQHAPINPPPAGLASDFDDVETDHIICGHIHPATTLIDFDGNAMKVPCFVVDPNQLILPAFGRFTGTHIMERQAGRQLLIASHGRVIKVQPV